MLSQCKFVLVMMVMQICTVRICVITVQICVITVQIGVITVQIGVITVQICVITFCREKAQQNIKEHKLEES